MSLAVAEVEKGAVVGMSRCKTSVGEIGAVDAL